MSRKIAPFIFNMIQCYKNPLICSGVVGVCFHVIPIYEGLAGQVKSHIFQYIA